MNTQLATVHRLIRLWQNRSFDEFIACFIDDLEYHYHMGSKPITNKLKLRKFLDNYATAFEQREWRVDRWASNGELLLVEGYEELFDPRHERIIKQPFVQAYEFRGDKIAKLRDYYDSANHQLPAGAATAKSA